MRLETCPRPGSSLLGSSWKNEYFEVLDHFDNGDIHKKTDQESFMTLENSSKKHWKINLTSKH